MYLLDIITFGPEEHTNKLTEIYRKLTKILLSVLPSKMIYKTIPGLPFVYLTDCFRKYKYINIIIK